MSYKRNRTTYEGETIQSRFVTFGTPLPNSDDDARDDGSYVPIWKQEVRDERGRKRLHGAFTGGFSAGYFNTVGSKEGWAPSTFLSSRANKTTDGAKQQQRVEDFMDEEDLADAAEAQTLQTSDVYVGFGSTSQDEKRNGFIMDLLRPKGDTMGVRLLRKMGWRDGQGVGARIRRRAFVGDETETGGMEQDTHLFAPQDSQIVSFSRKDDSKGLGFAGSDRLDSSNEVLEEDAGIEDEPFSFSTSRKSSKATPLRSHKKARSGVGIGIGVLNDNGSDEEDPYEVGPKILYNRTIGTDKKKSSSKASAKTAAGGIANPLLRTKPVFIPKRSTSTIPQFRRCHDGRLALDGFVLAEPSMLDNQEDVYTRPSIPDGWQSAKETLDPVRAESQQQTSAEAVKQSKLDPKSRAAILGEIMLPGKSVFDYLSTTARNRIASATGRSDLPAAKGEALAMTNDEVLGHDAVSSSSTQTIPELDRELALAALARGAAGWMPYADDEAKRGRYRIFLEFRGATNTASPEKPSGMDRNSWLQELREFAHAAQVFKPMTGMMASRFTSSSAAPQTSTRQGSTKDDALLSNPSIAVKVEDPAVAAAKMGMFGAMTRSVQSFYPTRLLCKRFNVPPPENTQPDDERAVPFSGDGGRKSRASGAPADLVSAAVLQAMIRENTALQVPSGAVPEHSADAQPVETVAESVVVDPSINEALEARKAGEAVFKAIFGDDSD